jgi:putative ABC transport system permease protein
MIVLALRNLVSEKTRFAFSATGIGFAVFLITILLGLYQGWNVKVGGFVEKVDGDAWVVREGTTDFINAASILPESMQADLMKTGPASVTPMIVRPMSFQKDGHNVDVQTVGYDVATGIGGPPRVISGRGDPHGAEMIVDDVLARTKGLHIGDTLTFGQKSVTVIGISSGGDFAFTQAGFMDLQGARDLLGMGGLATFYIVKMPPGVTVAQWKTQVDTSKDGTHIFTSKEFASATRHRILDNVIPIIGLILGLAFIVGIAITSLTIYTATVERTREFGVLKAVGFNNLDLYKLVMAQSLITGGVGFVFGVALTLILSQFVDQLVATFIVLVRPIDVGFVLIVTLAMAAGAAVVPARRVASVDPVVAFRG